MSNNKGTLKLRVKVGESILIGDSEVKIESTSDTGWSVNVCVIADRAIRVGRKKTPAKTLFEQPAPDDSITDR